MTASDLLDMQVIDGIVPEPNGGAHLDPEAAAQALREVLQRSLNELAPLSAQEVIEQRYNKFRQMGNLFFTEVSA
jgi:acetyl-CoA carboxylase carboxyl transferase subunit alpha